jgi:signal transduction histidine kinase
MSASTPSSARLAPVAVLAVTLFVFALVVAYVTLWLRSGLRQQILQREAEALTEVASLQLTTEADALAQLGIKDAPGQLLNAVLKTSKLRGVFAVRVFDAEQHVVGALPFPWSDSPPPSADWSLLLGGAPIVRLHARETAAEVVGLVPDATNEEKGEPLLETWLPLRRADSARVAGAAQLWTDGHAVATEFGALDQRLFTQAILAWGAGAAIIGYLLTWAFRRLDAANRELRARSEDLLRANRELALAAKASALGTVTAHLMHELKNPVAGLEEFVASQSEGGAPDDGGELAAASELTRRLRRMINDVVGVMRDEQTGAHFELSAAEVTELAVDHVRRIAEDRGVALRRDAHCEIGLPARRANLAGLVLRNLLQNAIEASPTGAAVRVTADTVGDTVRFSVVDSGPGLPPSVRARLFQPCTSTKAGGSGLGLALSQQLARQAGGEIRLLRSEADGTCFQLILDLKE